MGRKREYKPREIKDELQVGKERFPRDRGNPEKIKTVEQFNKFLDSSLGPTSYFVEQQKLFEYDDNFNRTVNPAAVRRAAASVTGEIISTRELPRDYFVNLVEESTGLKGRKAINAAARQEKFKARAILLAAEVGNVKISPDQKGYLNAAAQGRFFEKVYGERGQFDSGTIVSRMRSTRKARSSDPSVYARAREQTEMLRENTTRRGGSGSTLNPFSKSYKGVDYSAIDF